MEEKADTLKEFDSIITGLRRLVQSGPNYKDYDKSEKKYQAFRTRAIKLLLKIESPDKHLNDGLDYFRTVDLTLNGYNALQVLRRLRSDYEADVFTLRPELFQPLPAVTVTEKRRWLDEPKAVIIAAIITAISVIIAALMGILIGQSNSPVYTITATNSPSITFTWTAKPSLDLTLAATVEP